LTITVVSFLAVTGSIFFFHIAQERGDSIQEKEISHISTIYPNYLGVRFLEGNATAIVIGEVLGIKGSNTDSMVPTTDFAFRVDKVIKGQIDLGTIIAIRQSGGESNESIIYEETDDPPLEQGERFLGFMRYAEEEDVYVILGGPQGRFEEENGMLSSLDNRDPNAGWIPVKVKDVPVDQFEERIRSEAAP
jgi:hypothetical protein